MGLNWNEIKSRALLFSKTWADACNEDSEAKPFWIAFFEIFGITDKRVATFELNVKKLGGAQGYVDLFWPGVLLVEHKSRGKNLDDAVDQAVGYLHNLAERDLPQLVVVCDFARFRVRILATGETLEFELQHLHKHVKLFGLLAGYKVQDIRAEDPVNIKAGRVGAFQTHGPLARRPQGQRLQRPRAGSAAGCACCFACLPTTPASFSPRNRFATLWKNAPRPMAQTWGRAGAQVGQLHNLQVLNTHEASRSQHINTNS